jgi:PAS domain S-box-containing protein/diguanylate cyclase (GGDEF)-like protein
VNTATLHDAELYRAILESLPVGLYVVDPDRKILLWNEAAERISGYRAAEVTGRHCHDNILVHCDRHGSVSCGGACPLAETMHDGHPRETEVFLRHKLGHRVPVYVRALPLRKECGTIVGAVEIFEARASAPEPERREIDLDRHSEAGRRLLDRPLLELLLAEQFREFKAWHKPFAVLCIRIENLNHFIEMYGRPAADEVIAAITGTVTGSLRHTDHVGRWTLDRMVAIMPNFRAPALPEIARRLRELLAQTAVLWWGDRLAVALTVGAAGVQEGDTAESILGRCEESPGS